MRDRIKKVRGNAARYMSLVNGKTSRNKGKDSFESREAVQDDGRFKG